MILECSYAIKETGLILWLMSTSDFAINPWAVDPWGGTVLADDLSISQGCRSNLMKSQI
jgi:hypothetical protein